MSKKRIEEDCVRVAVLGGGVGAMVAAYELASGPRAEDYCITIYQQGWRLGGKGASGRNAEQGQRIEEHGAHIWFGFYENAFDVMGRAYQELQRPPGAPLRSLWDADSPAFKGRRDFVLEEHMLDGGWSGNIPSTVIDLSRGEDEMEVIREGLGPLDILN